MEENSHTSISPASQDLESIVEYRAGKKNQKDWKGHSIRNIAYLFLPM